MFVRQLGLFLLINSCLSIIYRPEFKLVTEIVGDVLKKLGRASSSDGFKKTFRIAKLGKNVERLLSKGLPINIRIVGIPRIEDRGKVILASATY